MPNEVTALIPHRPPFLFVDRILSADTESLVAERTWAPEEEFYRGHYPEAPITPGVLLCEAVFQTGALYMAKRANEVRRTARAAEPSSSVAQGVPLLAKISDVRFRSPVFPGDVVQIEVRKKETLGGFTMMDGAIRKADGTRVLNVSFAVAWKTPEGGGTEASAGGQPK